LSTYDSFDQLVDTLVAHREHVRGLEERLKRAEGQRDEWRDRADPGWRQREIEACLDGEIRLLRAQG